MDLVSFQFAEKRVDWTKCRERARIFVTTKFCQQAGGDCGPFRRLGGWVKNSGDYFLVFLFVEA